MEAARNAPHALREYLEALHSQDWDRLERALAPAVHRIGPYGDVVDGARPYRAFLEEVVSALVDYDLQVSRVFHVADSSGGVWVRLAETFTDEAGDRVPTEEALYFELDDDGRVAHVEVFLRKSV